MNMKIIILRIIFIILLIGTFSVIFGFSNQNSDESRDVSRRATEFLTDKIEGLQGREDIIDRIEKIIRKIAHFSIYTVVRNIAYGII